MAMGFIQRNTIRLYIRIFVYLVCFASCLLVYKIKTLDTNRLPAKEVILRPGLSDYEYRYEDIFGYTTHDILKMPKIEFVPKLRDACFFVRYKNKRILRCIPKTYIVGFNKCGTTDLSSTIPRQHFIRLAYIKEPLFWADTRVWQNFTLGQYSEVFNFVASANYECCLNLKGKGFKLQDGIIPHNNITIQDNEREWFNNEYKRTIENKYIKDTCGKLRKEMKETGVCPVSLLDASPVTAWFLRREYQPNGDPEKTAFDEPLTPAKLKHVIPDAKIIFMMRDPVERLWSDYNFYYPYEDANVKLSADHFHSVVSDSIAWWHKCVEILPLKRCLYDYNFEGTGLPSIPEYWEEDISVSGVARIRIGLYVLYINHWLEYFAKDQCLFLRLESYKVNKEATLNNIVYPFMGYDSKTLKDEPTVLKTKYSVNTMHNKTDILLREFHRPFNTELADLLQNTGYHWLDD